MHSKELKIGIFVITVLVASFFLINYLRGEDIFNREISLISDYDNVEGLVASAPVYIRGYKAGKVSEVTYNPESDAWMRPEGWYMPGPGAEERGLVHTYGNPPEMPMYLAVKELEERLAEIAQEVFNDDRY